MTRLIPSRPLSAAPREGTGTDHLDMSSGTDAPSATPTSSFSPTNVASTAMWTVAEVYGRKCATNAIPDVCPPLMTCYHSTKWTDDEVGVTDDFPKVNS